MSDAEQARRARVRVHRARLRGAGLRPVQIWVPDVRSPQFAEEAHRQSQVVAGSSHAEEDQDVVEAMAWDAE